MENITHNEFISPPVFVMDDPNFLGLPTQNGEQRCRAHEGERKIDVSLQPCYVHGQLQHLLGYDIAMFARGYIRDVNEQDAVVIDADGVEHQCIIVSRRLPYAEKPTRAALIVDPSEKETVGQYLVSKIADTSEGSPKPIL
jgi:hypothetical protein